MHNMKGIKNKIESKLNQGKSYRQTAKELGISSPSVISYWVNKEPRYKSNNIICPRCGGKGVCEKFVGEVGGQ